MHGDKATYLYYAQPLQVRIELASVKICQALK